MKYMQLFKERGKLSHFRANLVTCLNKWFGLGEKEIISKDKLPIDNDKIVPIRSFDTETSAAKMAEPFDHGECVQNGMKDIDNNTSQA